MINLKSLVNIDRLAYPFYAAFYPLLSWSKPHKAREKEDIVIVIKMLGIGSITRIFSTLEQQKVDLSRVYFLTLSSNKQLSELLNIPNTIFLEADKWPRLLPQLWRIVQQIRKYKPAYIVDYERSSNLLGLFRGITTLFSSIRTVSFYKIPEDRKSGPDVQFSLDDRSINDLIDLSLPYLPKKAADLSTQEKPLPLQIAMDKVLVNVNASDYLPHRKYPLASFAQVISGLLKISPASEISLIGSADEKDYVQSLIKDYLEDNTRVKNCCGEWSLKKLAEELESASLLITNDSGPMHLAVMKQVNTVVIWGPTTPEIFGYTDYPNVINIQSGRACAPCFTYPKSKAALACKGQIDCMKDIRPEVVVSAANKLLTKYQETA